LINTSIIYSCSLDLFTIHTSSNILLEYHVCVTHRIQIFILLLLIQLYYIYQMHGGIILNCNSFTTYINNINQKINISDFNTKKPKHVEIWIPAFAISEKSIPPSPYNSQLISEQQAKNNKFYRKHVIKHNKNNKWHRMLFKLLI
jgi:hypothetical protein